MLCSSILGNASGAKKPASFMAVTYGLHADTEQETRGQHEHDTLLGKALQSTVRVSQAANQQILCDSAADYKQRSYNKSVALVRKWYHLGIVLVVIGCMHSCHLPCHG